MLKSLSIHECRDQFGWSPLETMKVLQQIDFEVFPGLPIEHYGQIEDWVEKWIRLPEAGQILVTSEGEAVGYWSFAPLTTEQRLKFEAGIFFDTDMKAETIPDLIPNESNFVYVSAVVIRESFRTGAALLYLYRSFLNQLIKLAERSIYVDLIYANAFSPEGIRLCQQAGAKKLSDHTDEGVVYGLSMFPFPDSVLFRSFVKLKELYSTEGSRRANVRKL